MRRTKREEAKPSFRFDEWQAAWKIIEFVFYAGLFFIACLLIFVVVVGSMVLFKT